MITITPPDGRDQWIFSQVQQRPPGERAAFLDGACAFDKGLPLLTGGGGLAFLPPDGNTLISSTSEESVSGARRPGHRLRLRPLESRRKPGGRDARAPVNHDRVHHNAVQSEECALGVYRKADQLRDVLAVAQHPHPLAPKWHQQEATGDASGWLRHCLVPKRLTKLRRCKPLQIPVLQLLKRRCLVPARLPTQEHQACGTLALLEFPDSCMIIARYYVQSMWR